MMTKNNKRD